jgi:hypothetical protein
VSAGVTTRLIGAAITCARKGVLRSWQRIAIVSVALLSWSAAVRAQRTGADTTDGSVVVLRTTRGGTAMISSERSTRAGVLVRRRGSLLRLDMLRTLRDTAGAEWVLVDAADTTMHVHNRDKRLVLSMRMTDILRLFAAALNARADSMSVQTRILGPGEVRFGVPTTRVMTERRIRIRLARAGQQQTLVLRSSTESLIAPSLSADLGASHIVNSTAGGDVTLLETFLATRRDTTAAPRVVVPGLALRSITTSDIEITGANILPKAAMGPSHAVDTIEVLSIAQRRLPAALFESPSGYRREDLATVVRDLEALGAPTRKSGLSGLGKGATGTGKIAFPRGRKP